MTTWSSVSLIERSQDLIIIHVKKLHPAELSLLGLRKPYKYEVLLACRLVWKCKNLGTQVYMLFFKVEGPHATKPYVTGCNQVLTSLSFL